MVGKEVGEVLGKTAIVGNEVGSNVLFVVGCDVGCVSCKLMQVMCFENNCKRKTNANNEVHDNMIQVL